MSLVVGFFLFFSGISEARELIFTHIIYRHGARSPSRTYPNDVYQESYWLDGWNQLTKIGMKEQFDLGQFLRRRYIMEKKFLSPNYTKSEIYVRSTNKDRALESAAANLAGFYPPESGQIWNKNLKWQPIPVHCEAPTDEDLLLKPTSVDCPNYDIIHEKHAKERFKPFNEKFQSFFQFFNAKTGVIQPIDIETVAEYGYSPIKAEITEGLQQPDWVNQTWNDTTTFGSNLTVFSVMRAMKTIVRLTGFDKPVLAKLIGGYLLNDILDRMKQISLNKTRKESEPNKMIIYSTHQGTVLGLMFNMGIQNGLLLGYASCLMIELYRNENDYSVEIYMRNSTDQTVPTRLYPPGCDSKNECLLETVTEKYKNSVFKSREDWKVECGLSNHKSEDAQKTGLTIAIAVLAVITAVLVAFLCFLLFKMKNKQKI